MQTDSGCKNAENAAQIPVRIERLEETLANLQDSAKAKAFLGTFPALAKNYFYMGVHTLADTNAVLQQLVSQAKDPFMDTIRQDIRHFYPSLEPLQAELGVLFGRVKKEYPDFVPPKHVYSLASGFAVDILYLDSLMLLGLEYFLPDSAHYEPPQTPRYIRVRLRPNTLVPGVAKLLSDRYIKTEFAPEQAIVEEMVRWGKVLYFQKSVLPCLPDSVLFGYTAQTLKDVDENDKVIYAHFVDKGLFFNTDHLLRSKYVGERPSIPEIGDKCPGRIGQWMGYQIVAKWAADKNKTLRQVLEEPDGRKIFNEARWKPE
jgi:hypothetical protein